MDDKAEAEPKIALDKYYPSKNLEPEAANGNSIYFSPFLKRITEPFSKQNSKRTDNIWFFGTLQLKL